MRTRRSYFSPANTIPRHSRRKNSGVVESEIRTNVTMADRTMEELLQDPSEGYGEAIVIPEILAKNFEIKTNLLQLVRANKFHGRENDNPRTHVSNFKRMTATLKYRDVPNDAIKLMLFPYSLEDRARIWRQLATNPEMCMYALTVSTTKPKNIKEAMADSAWIEAMQEELHQFDRLQESSLWIETSSKGVV
nr:reverse transcriptase domain-containing protein [Tanacetum cinerariifolium]